ncbi:MAG: lysine--tRNA ligase [Campylobacterales bacterium]
MTLFENQYEQQRIAKATELRELGLNPYENRSRRDTRCAEFLDRYAFLHEAENRRDESATAVVAGRIKFLRHMGKASFVKIEDESGMLQAYISRDEIGDEAFKIFKKLYEVGDIIEVEGFPFVTNSGELSIHARTLMLLTKAICLLPEKFHGLTDMETRYRQRYLDLIMNKDVREVFRTRSRIVSIIRRFFEEKGFLEVETPMMHPIAGGANARPFVTYHNALGVERYLRIAPELYLKRLIVGGFEAVFEINRNFRNEGMDHTHNPEFTMIEFYWAYHTYEDLMKLTEELFRHLFAELNLPLQLPYGDLLIDFSTFARYSYNEAIITIGGVPESALASLESAWEYLKSQGVEVERPASYGHALAELFDAFVEAKLINPTFITDFPIAISPLARRNDANPEIADRFELFIAGKEIGNGFSELNDPIDQYHRFAAQLEAKEAGDDEAHEMDEDYVRALGYGMPPTAGEGIGIDRLVMLLTNQHSIRDVLLFPAMKPLHHEIKKDNE